MSTVAQRLLTGALALLLAAAGFAATPAGRGWPREVHTGDSTIVVYQPQFDSLDGINAKARIAVAIRRQPGTEPEFGALWVAATLAVDRDDGTAVIQRLVIERARFPDATDAEVKELTARLERVVPNWDLDLSLAELKAGLQADNAGDDPAFRNDPPKIVFRDKVAILVTLDGPPRLQAIRDTAYQRVINTPFPIVFDPRTREYWLYGSDVWFVTRDLLRGPWSARDGAPVEIAQLFTARPGEAPRDPGERVPKDKLRQAEIVVATEPTELISTDGEPQYQALVGDEMLYVTNTGSDLFLEVPTRQYYVVLSGRWYRARSLNGPWAYVDPGQVPKTFADVPRKSGKADVLAHVPGTDEAKDAMMDAMIPQTSAIRRSEAKFDVTWDGVPQFDRIPGTELLYARNTASQVLKYRDRFYAVDQGVWYVASSADGPWAVADSRPEEVANIPPSSPAYNVKYVYIYDYTPDVVYVGYLPGYTWAFPYQGTIVYGTGYYYQPWSSPAWYYPRPSTWGFHMHYNPWFGWGYGLSWSAGWNSFSSAWGPAWGPGWGYRDSYWNGYYPGFWGGQYTGGWFGPGGYRPPPHWSQPRPEPRRGFRPPDRTQISAQPVPGTNLYSRPGISRGNRKDTQPMPHPTSRLPNDVFVDREGIPHRSTQEGWQTHQNNRWRPSPELNRRRPDPTPVLAERPTPHYRPSPPVEVARPAPPVRARPPEYRPEPGSQPPPSGGWGNHAGPRDGPSLPSARESRQRSHELSQRHER